MKMIIEEQSTEQVNNTIIDMYGTYPTSEKIYCNLKQKYNIMSAQRNRSFRRYIIVNPIQTSPRIERIYYFYFNSLIAIVIAYRFFTV